MKKLLSAATVALLSTAGIAQANDIAYSGNVSALQLAGQVALGGGPGYGQFGLNTGNFEAASPTVSHSWDISGEVQKDCSFYSQGQTSNHQLNFGVLGVNNQSNTSLNDAFDMRSAAVANVTTTTAGCNANNTVTITKTNGSDGLVSDSTDGFNSADFTNKIPYSVTAVWLGTASTSGSGSQSGRLLDVSTGEGSDSLTGGAWKSAFNMTITAPKPQKALISGNYTDKVTVELTTAI
ncbi:hypothetical protein FHS95_003293 [Sphingomonas naasensis]|uniref:Spore coat protein U domain-containing protein n=1 Tax=Sphingomonas naasensis TaxID=1344951 RepID=A0A4S1WIG0_9SPHN|nr:hypothetical protein [Sphingomonas naasensis]NIJ21590.1 hypothetical protein [Sphingomonas naasensis]TGX41470.1 hypothetical protein E5A74_12640 [Sphingomonas naasensis]